MPVSYDDAHIRELGNLWISTGEALQEQVQAMDGAVNSLTTGWTGKAGDAAHLVWSGVADHNIKHALLEAASVSVEIGQAILKYADELEKAIDEINRAALIGALTTIFGTVLGVASFGIGAVLGRLAALVGRLVQSIAASISRIAAAAGTIGRAATFTADSLFNAGVTLGTDLLSQWLGSEAGHGIMNIDWKSEGLNIGVGVWAGWGMGGVDILKGPSAVAGGKGLPHLSSPTPTPTPTKAPDVPTPHGGNIPNVGLPHVGDLAPFPNSLVKTNHAPPTGAGVTNRVTATPGPNAGTPGKVTPPPGNVRPGQARPGVDTPGTPRPDSPLPDLLRNTSAGPVVEGGGQPPTVRPGGVRPEGTTPAATGPTSPPPVRPGEAPPEGGTPAGTGPNGPRTPLPGHHVPNTPGNDPAMGGGTPPTSIRNNTPTPRTPHAFLDGPPRSTGIPDNHEVPPATPTPHGAGGPARDNAPAATGGVPRTNTPRGEQHAPGTTTSHDPGAGEAPPPNTLTSHAEGHQAPLPDDRAGAGIGANAGAGAGAGAGRGTTPTPHGTPAEGTRTPQAPTRPTGTPEPARVRPDTHAVADGTHGATDLPPAAPGRSTGTHGATDLPPAAPGRGTGTGTGTGTPDATPVRPDTHTSVTGGRGTADAPSGGTRPNASETPGIGRPARDTPQPSRHASPDAGAGPRDAGPHGGSTHAQDTPLRTSASAEPPAAPVRTPDTRSSSASEPPAATRHDAGTGATAHDGTQGTWHGGGHPAGPGHEAGAVPVRPDGQDNGAGAHDHQSPHTPAPEGGVHPEQQWLAYKAEHNERSLPVLGAEARLESHQEGLASAWDKAYETFVGNNVFGDSRIARDGLQMRNAHWQWRNDMTRQFRAEVDRTGHISSGAFDRIVHDAKENAYKHIVRADQNERFAAAVKERVDSYKANRFGDGEFLPDFDHAPSKSTFDKDLNRFVRDDGKLYGHPDDGTAAPGDPFRDKSHDFNVLEQYYLSKEAQLNRILDRFLHDGESGGGLPARTGREIDTLLDGTFDDIGAIATRERDIRTATGERFDDIIRWNSRGGDALSEDFVTKVRQDFEHDLRTDHDLIFRHGDGDGPRAMWDLRTNRAIDELPGRIAREHFVRGRVSEETAFAQNHLSELGGDFLDHFGQGGRERVVGEHIDAVRAAAGRHFDELLDNPVKAGEPTPEWTGARDDLRSLLPERIRHEGDLQAVVREGAHAFHEIAGHPGSTEAFQLHEDTVSRLGNDFRTERVTKYDELFALDGHKTSAWLSHESRGEDGFQVRLDELRDTDYIPDLQSWAYPEFRDWRAGPGTPVEGHQSPRPNTPDRPSPGPGTPDHPVSPDGSAAPEPHTSSTVDEAPAEGPAVTPTRSETPTPTRTQTDPPEQTQIQAQAPAPAPVRTRVETQAPPRTHTGEQTQVTVERNASHSPDTTAHTPDTSVHTQEQPHQTQGFRQDDAQTADLPTEVGRIARRNSEFTGTRAQVEHVHQRLLEQRPDVATLSVKTQAMLVADAMLRSHEQMRKSATETLLRYTGRYPDSRRIQQVHQELFDQFGTEFQDLTPAQRADLVVARTLDERFGATVTGHDTVEAVDRAQPAETTRDLPADPVVESRHVTDAVNDELAARAQEPVSYADVDDAVGQLVTEKGAAFTSLSVPARVDAVVTHILGSRGVEVTDAAETVQPGPVDKGKAVDRGRHSEIQEPADGQTDGPDLDRALRELQAEEPVLHDLTPRELRDAFHIQQQTDPAVFGVDRHSRLHSLGRIGRELHQHGAEAAWDLAGRLSENGPRAGAFGGSPAQTEALSTSLSTDTAAPSTTLSTDTAGPSQTAAPTQHLVPEAQLSADAKSFLATHVLSLDMKTGLETHAPGLGAKDLDGFINALNILPGKAGHLPEHRFVLSRQGTDIKGKPVFALTPAVEWYVARYGADRFAFDGGTVLPPLRADGDYVNAVFVPYLTRGSEDYANNVGHADVLKHPGLSDPRLVLTPTMNGCAYAVTPSAQGDRMTVWHYQSPDTKMPAPVVFRREQRPTDWYGAHEYYGGDTGGKLFEVANVMSYGTDGWEFISQETHTGAEDATMELKGVRSRPAHMEPGHELTYTKTIYKGLLHSEQHDWDLPQALRNINAGEAETPERHLLVRMHDTIAEHIESESKRLDTATTMDELRGLSDTFKAKRAAMKSSLEAIMAHASAVTVPWVDADRTRGAAVRTRLRHAERMVDQFVDRPALDWIDQLRGEAAPEHPRTMAASYLGKARTELNSPFSTVNIEIARLQKTKPKGTVGAAVSTLVDQVRRQIEHEMDRLGRDKDFTDLRGLADQFRQERDDLRMLGEAEFQAITRNEKDRKTVGRFLEMVMDLLNGLVTPRLEDWITGLREAVAAVTESSAWQRLPHAEQTELGRQIQDRLPDGVREDAFFDLRVRDAYDGLDDAVRNGPLSGRADQIAGILYGGPRSTGVDDLFVHSVNAELTRMGRAKVSPWRVHQAHQKLESLRGTAFSGNNSGFRAEAVAVHLAGLGRTGRWGGARDTSEQPRTQVADTLADGGRALDGEQLDEVQEHVRLLGRAPLDVDRAVMAQRGPSDAAASASAATTRLGSGADVSDLVRPHEELRSAYAWLDDVNPYRERGGEFLTNCVLTAIAVDMTLREGAVHQASPAEPGGVRQPAGETSGLHHYLANYLDRVPDPVHGVAEIVAAMSDAPVGARGMVVIERTHGRIDHVVNVTHDRDGVVFLDGQSGTPVHAPDRAVSFLPTTEGIPGHPLHRGTATALTTPSAAAERRLGSNLTTIPEVDETPDPVQEPAAATPRTATIGVDLAERRPPRLDRELPPAPTTTGRVRFSDGTRLPVQMAEGVASRLTTLPPDVVRRAFSFGQSNPRLRGIDRVVHELGQRLTDHRSTSPALAEDRTPSNPDLLDEVRHALRDDTRGFFGDGKSFTYRTTEGKTRVLQATTRPYGNWERFTFGYANPVKNDVMRRSTTTGGQVKTNSTSFGLAPTVPVGILRSFVSPWARTHLQVRFGKHVKYNQQRQVMNQTESRASDASHLHVDDVWYEFSVHDRRGRPVDLTGRAIAEGDTTRQAVSFGFAVRDGLEVRIADSMTSGEPLAGQLPERMTLGPEARYRMVSTEDFGPVGHIHDWVLKHAGVDPDTPAAAQIGTFFSTSGFHSMARVLNSGPTLTPPLLGGKNGADPLGVYSVRVESGEAVLISETKAAELRDIVQGTSRNERQVGKWRGVDVGVVLGPAFQLFGLSDNAFNVRAQAGLSARYASTRNRGTASGGTAATKVIGQAKATDTGLYLVQKTVTVTAPPDSRQSWSEAPRTETFQTFAIERMTRTEARRLAGLDKTPERTTPAPVAPVYLKADEPATLGMSRVEEFTFADGRVSTVVDGRTVTFPEHFADAVLREVGTVYPDLVAPLHELNPHNPRWRGADHFKTVLNNTVEVYKQLAHQSLATNVETMMTTGLRIDLVESGRMSRGHRYVEIRAKLTGRRYEGEQQDLRVRFSAPGTEVVGGGRSGSRGVQGGVEGVFSLRDADPDSIGWPQQVGALSAGVRFGRRTDSESGYGMTASNEHLSYSTGGSHLYSYELRLEAKRGGYSRPRRWMRGLVLMNVLGTQPFVFGEQERPLLTPRADGTDTAGLGRVLLSVPVEHSPATASRTSSAPASLNTPEALKSAASSQPMSRQEALDLALGTGKALADAAGREASVLAEHPHQTIAVISDQQVTTALETGLRDASGSSWVTTRKGSPGHDAAVLLSESRSLTANFDQSSTASGHRPAEIWVAAPYLNRSTWLTHRTTLLPGLTALTPAVMVNSDSVVGGTLHASGRDARTSTSFFGGQIAFRRSHDVGTGVTVNYGLVASPYRRDLSASLTVRRAAVTEVTRRDSGRHVLASASVLHEIAVASDRLGAWAHRVPHLPASLASAAGSRVVVPDGWLGHLPEKSAHRLGALKDAFGDVPLYTQRSWSPFPWLRGAFGGWPLNPLNTAAALSRFEEQLAPLGLTTQDREQLRHLVSGRVMRAVGKEMAGGTGASMPGRIGRWGSEWAEIWVGHRQVRLRVRLVPVRSTGDGFGGLGHSVELEEARQAVESLERARGRSTGRLIGLAVTTGAHTGNTSVPIVGPTYAQTGSSTQAGTQTLSEGTVDISTVAISQAHGEFATQYELKLDLEITGSRPGTPAPGEHTSTDRVRDTIDHAPQKWTGQRAHTISVRENVGRLIEHLPLSLMRPDPRTTAGQGEARATDGVDPLAPPELEEHTQPHRVDLPRAFGAGGWHDVAHRGFDAGTRPFEMPEQGFSVRGIIGLEGLHAANTLALGAAYGVSRSVPAHGHLDLDLDLLARARDTPLTRAGSGPAQSLEDGTSNGALAAFYERTLTPDGYQVAGLTDRGFWGGADGSLTLYSKPDLAGARLLTVTDGAKFEHAHRGSHGMGTAADRAGAAEHTLHAGPTISSPALGTNQIGSGSGAQGLDSAASGHTAEQLASVNIKPDKARTFLFAIPTRWLSVAHVRHHVKDSAPARLARSPFGNPQRPPRAMETDATVLAWVREDVARRLGLVDGRNFPAEVSASWDAVAAVDRAWTTADENYWNLRRGDGFARESELAAAEERLTGLTGGATLPTLSVEEARAALDALHLEDDADAEPAHEGWAEVRDTRLAQARAQLDRAVAEQRLNEVKADLEALRGHAETLASAYADVREATDRLTSWHQLNATPQGRAALSGTPAPRTATFTEPAAPELRSQKPEALTTDADTPDTTVPETAPAPEKSAPDLSAVPDGDVRPAYAAAPWQHEKRLNQVRHFDAAADHRTLTATESDGQRRVYDLHRPEAAGNGFYAAVLAARGSHLVDPAGLARRIAESPHLPADLGLDPRAVFHTREVATPLGRFLRDDPGLWERIPGDGGRLPEELRSRLTPDETRALVQLNLRTARRWDTETADAAALATARTLRLDLTVVEENGAHRSYSGATEEAGHSVAQVTLYRRGDAYLAAVPRPARAAQLQHEDTGPKTVERLGRTVASRLGGGSREHGLDPRAEGWETGRGITVMAPRFGLPEREQELPVTLPTRGGGKGAETFRSFSRPYPHSSRSYGYEVGTAGTVVLSDGTALSGDWTRFGDDFLHERGFVLRGDNGWLGRVDNWVELRAALPADGARYTLTTDESRMYFLPAEETGRTVVLPLTEEPAGAGTTAAETTYAETATHTEVTAHVETPAPVEAAVRIEAIDLLDPERFREQTTDPAASGLRSLSRVADLDRLLNEYGRIDEHDHALRADALDQLAGRARTYVSATKNEFRRRAVDRLAEQAETRAAQYRQQSGPASVATAETAATGPLGYRERIALAKRTWAGPVTEEVARLEQLLLEAGPGARSLVMGVVPGEQVWAMNIMGEIRWLEQSTAQVTRAPQAAQGVVMSIDLDPRARLIEPDPRLLADGADSGSARFCELVLGGDLKHVV